MSKINVKYMTDEAIDTLRVNMDWVTQNLQDSPTSYDWVLEKIPDKLFTEKKYVIDDFDLIVPEDASDKEVDIKNSITLFEHFKMLPQYVLTDERFWNWVNFEKGYSVALKYIPVKVGSSVFKDHWLFSNGQRRSLFFGVLSRCYFRVECTYDESLVDPYQLSKFAIENPERFRNFTWRTYSNEKRIVRAALKAEKDVLTARDGNENNSVYPELAKYVSKMGSVMLLDAMSDEDLYSQIYKEFDRLLTVADQKSL
ncbi:MAG: hypothetical protein I3I98_04830 [Mobilibacterium timonense]|uniref:DUF6339 family protein n=1 Tax=Mobilibacterium timonense TaxID=1871012 RepID=UPI0023521BDF|nr:DUF6339 family protein [Mobilibacterium timonense]MBM6990717.1 hypothetical protein [Mobilibacterium timonense]